MTSASPRALARTEEPVYSLLNCPPPAAPDVYEYVTELVRVMTPGGRLVCSRESIARRGCPSAGGAGCVRAGNRERSANRERTRGRG